MIIYIVDDERIIGEVLEILLQRAGFQSKLFENPKMALMDFHATHSKPALLLTDFDMDSMNGMELIENFKRTQPDVRTILLSGNGRDNFTSGYSVKPDRFISKPFEPNALIETIRSVIQEHI